MGQLCHRARYAERERCGGMRRYAEVCGGMLRLLRFGSFSQQAEAVRRFEVLEVLSAQAAGGHGGCPAAPAVRLSGHVFREARLPSHMCLRRHTCACADVNMCVHECTWHGLQLLRRRKSQRAQGSGAEHSLSFRRPSRAPYGVITSDVGSRIPGARDM